MDTLKGQDNEEVAQLFSTEAVEKANEVFHRIEDPFTVCQSEQD